MNCPMCEGVSLTMTERSGIEIDYCPKCRGVWLDRGELDKIIERSAAAAPSPPPAYAPEQGRGYAQPPQPPHGHTPHQQAGGYYKKKKREGFLGELFDFD